MPINKQCLTKLNQLGLPMTVSVHNKTDQCIGSAEISKDGTTVFLATGVRYRHPSHLRAELIEPNGQTYTRFKLNGVDLRTLGVAP